MPLPPEATMTRFAARASPRLAVPSGSDRPTPHSSPSQNPDPAAQQPIDTVHARRERRSAFVGGALLAGIAIGTAAGTALAGAPGVLVGVGVGALLGGAGGYAAGAWVPSPG
jgi:hypothetical protein